MEYLQSHFDKYGVIRVFSYFGWTIFVGDSEISKEISIKSDVFEKLDLEKTKLSHLFMKFYGKTQVLNSNGEKWERQRNVLNPVFNRTWPTELFGSYVFDLIEEWEKLDGQEVYIHDKIQRMSLDVFGKALFDVDLKAIKDTNSRIYNLYTEIFSQILKNIAYVFLPVLEYLPYFRRPELAKKLEEYHEFIEDKINSKKQEFIDGRVRNNGDLVTALVQSHLSNDSGRLSLDEIRDNLNIFIIAGHDTTSNTLSSTLYYLARYPEFQEKLRDEVLTAMNNSKDVKIPTIEQLKNISFMDMVIKESMRIMTTASSLSRITAVTHTLNNGLVIPKGTPITLHMWGVHHNSNIYPNPDEFNPYRFSDLSSEANRNWQAFTLGNRKCIGSKFALVQQRVTLAMLLQKFKFSINQNNPDYDKLRISPNGIIRPKDLKISIKLRN